MTRGGRSRGYALIEVMVIITLTTVMLGLCAGLIHLLLKLDRSGRDAAEQAGDLARLARDFREDAHAANSAGPPTLGPLKLTFATAPGRSVEYEARAADVLRTVREGDKVRRLEFYRRPPRSAVRFETSGAAVPFAALILDRPADFRDDSSLRGYRIEAEVGRDGRLGREPR